MPAKNVLKQYLENGYYHIYNRGVEERSIFQDDQDFKVFLSYLKDYLKPKDEMVLRKVLSNISFQEKDKILKKISLNNYSDSVDLLAYCLMTNHFHLLIKQKTERAIENFMRSLGTRYVVYFNKRHKRIGGLFQDAYKAVLVETDEQLLHLSRYIHLNPFTQQGDSLQGVSFTEVKDYEYSSLDAYFGKWSVEWLKPDVILDYFSNTNKNLSYESFVLVEDRVNDSHPTINKLILD